VGKIGVVDLLEIGFGQLAVARQSLVDDLVEGGIVSGRVDVPYLLIARHGGLPQRPDLPERKFGEGHRAFMFVEHFDPSPNGGPRCSLPAPIIKLWGQS